MRMPASLWTSCSFFPLLKLGQYPLVILGLRICDFKRDTILHYYLVCKQAKGGIGRYPYSIAEFIKLLFYVFFQANTKSRCRHRLAPLFVLVVVPIITQTL